MDWLNAINRYAYLARRTRADYRAYERGGSGAVAKRVVRRKVNSRIFSQVRKIEKQAGL